MTRAKMTKALATLKKEHPEVAVWVFRAAEDKYLAFEGDAKPVACSEFDLSGLIAGHCRNGRKCAIIEERKAVGA